MMASLKGTFDYVYGGIKENPRTTIFLAALAVAKLTGAELPYPEKAVEWTNAQRVLAASYTVQFLALYSMVSKFADKKFGMSEKPKNKHDRSLDI